VKWFSKFVSLKINLASLPTNELIQLSITTNPCLLWVDHFCHGKFVQIHSKFCETQSEFGCILV
jgi:hypothetical protein